MGSFSQKSSISPPALTQSLNSDIYDDQGTENVSDLEISPEIEDSSSESDRIDLTKQLLVKR